MKKIDSTERNGRIILVSGAHRSGTTWLGKLLASSDEVLYLQEPMNITNPYNYKLVPYWFYYITSDDHEILYKYFSHLFRSRHIDYVRAMRNVDYTTIMGILRFFKYSKYHLRVSLRASEGKRFLSKDPHALLSIDWFTENFPLDAIILIRHPAAFVNSLLKVGWSHPFEHFVKQEYLMDTVLNSYADEIFEYAKTEKSILDQGILLWNILYSRVCDYSENQNVILLRHEDLSAFPMQGLEALYDTLGLKMTEQCRAIIQEYCYGTSEFNNKKTHHHKRDSSANIKLWKKKLSAQEISIIRSGTEKVGHLYYNNGDW